MIKQVTGDLLLSRAAAIAHGVAPNDTFNQGLALSLRSRAPALYKDFRHFCQTYHPKPGGLWGWSGPDSQRVICLFTQEAGEGHHGKPGRAAEKYVHHALKELRALCATEKFASLALPRLATGVGGLEWTVVLPLIEQHLGTLDIPVYVYSNYQQGVAANEG